MSWTQTLSQGLVAEDPAHNQQPTQLPAHLVPDPAKARQPIALAAGGPVRVFTAEMHPAVACQPDETVLGRVVVDGAVAFDRAWRCAGSMRFFSYP